VKLRFQTLDVFADRPFAGNPLAVVFAGDALRPGDMLAIAREFNLSETVFLLEPRDPVNTARARIFTPTEELPFAGHPTIGAAAALAKARAGDILGRSDVVVALEEGIGTLRCEILRSRQGVIYAQFDAPLLPERAADAASPDDWARALSLAPGEVGFGAHRPGVWSAGLPIAFVPVASRAAVDRARRGPAFSTAAGDAKGVFIYCAETVDPDAAIHARMLANGLGFDEDPATGSAAAAFAGVALAMERPEDGEHELFIEQGFAMGRPSRITLRMSVTNGALTHVAIGGCVAFVGEGTLTL